MTGTPHRAESVDGSGHELLVLHLQADDRQPAELLSLTALPVDHLGTAGCCLRWTVQPVRPLSAALVHKLKIRPDEQAAARPWEDLAVDVATALGTRPVVVLQGWREFCLLERYLPGWRPDQVYSVSRLAQRLGRRAEITAAWSDADCPDAARVSLLHQLLAELVTGGHHTWAVALDMAALPLGRYQPEHRVRARPAAANTEPPR